MRTQFSGKLNSVISILSIIVVNSGQREFVETALWWYYGLDGNLWRSAQSGKLLEAFMAHKLVLRLVHGQLLSVYSWALTNLDQNIVLNIKHSDVQIQSITPNPVNCDTTS